MNVFTILSVAIGGALGALARWGFSSMIGKQFDGDHWGILAANLLGCLLIGVAQAAVDHLDWGSATVRLFVFTGFIGSFTTFSTFKSDIVSLWSDGNQFIALVYVSLSIGGGLLAYLAGWWVTTKAVS